MAKKITIEVDVPEPIDPEELGEKLREAALLIIWLNLPPAPGEAVENLSKEAKRRVAMKLREKGL